MSPTSIGRSTPKRGRDQDDPNAIQSGTNAFTVLMTAQAKRQRLDRAGCRHSLDGAFAEMMAAARVPGAFDRPPTETEGSAETEDRDCCLNEVDPKVSELLESMSMRVPKFSDDDESCHSEGDGDDNSNHGEQPAPEAQSEPSAGTVIRGICTYFARYASNTWVIKGFVLKYSDGLEISTGDIRDCVSVEIRLDRGEHVVAIKPQYQYDDKIQRHYLRKVVFVTNFDRAITPQKKKRHVKYSCFFDGPPPYKYGEKDLKAESGTIIVSFDLINNGSSMTNLKTMRINELAPEHLPIGDKRKSSPFPSLVSLARAAIRKNIAMTPQVIEEDSKDRLQRAHRECNLQVRFACEDGKIQLKSSAEAADVRRLREQLAFAEERLVAKSTGIRENVTRKVNTAVQKGRAEHREIINDRRMKLQKHYEELRYCKETLVHIGQLNEGSQMCPVSECGSFFEQSKVPEWKRCSVERCALQNGSSCGCNVKVCKRCHDAICSQHANVHESQCKWTSPGRCGYSGFVEDVIIPQACGRASPKRDFCGRCGVLCCEDCSKLCFGALLERQCLRVWCKRCLEPGSGAKPCCDNFQALL